MNFQLFSDLESLVKTTETFYRQEFKLDGKIYWIYNYRLSSYSDFLLPNARWCRGTMFEVDDQGNMIRLASLPMQKFWNINENPHTMNLDLDYIDWIEVKSDGSLISTYIHDGNLRLKSKGSIDSEQSRDAMAFLEKHENLKFKERLLFATSSGFTVNMEWVAPWNRIVLGYEFPELIVLNMIMNRDMETYSHQETSLMFDSRMRPRVDPGELSMKEFIELVPSMLDDIEGFIFVMNDGQRVKVKTDKYISLHHAKDSVNNPRRLFECILDEASDDLRSMFATDKLALVMIEEMEEKVKHLYNHMVATVEKFYSDNRHLERKQFAMLGRDVLNDLLFPLVMNLYIDRGNDYKAWMKKKYKELGFQDHPLKQD